MTEKKLSKSVTAQTAGCRSLLPFSVNNYFFLRIITSAACNSLLVSELYFSVLRLYVCQTILLAVVRASLRSMPSASAVLMVILHPGLIFCIISFITASFTATQPPV